MREWLTEFRTFDGLLWAGDTIIATSKNHARHILDTSGRGYMEVIGWLVATVDEFTGERIDKDSPFVN